MRGRAAPPHPGIYRVPPPPPPAPAGRFTSWMARKILNFNSVRYRKSNRIIQEFWERFLSNVVSWNGFVHRLMSHSVWNHIACLYYMLTVESKWLNSCISLKIKKYFKSHHVLPFFRCYFHFFVACVSIMTCRMKRKDGEQKCCGCTQTTTNDKRPYIDRQCGRLPAVPHNIKTNVYS